MNREIDPSANKPQDCADVVPDHLLMPVDIVGFEKAVMGLREALRATIIIPEPAEGVVDLYVYAPSSIEGFDPRQIADLSYKFREADEQNKK